MRKRATSSILVGTVAVLLVVSPVWPDALTSAVTDPVGDSGSFAACEGLTCPPYQDIARAEITKRGGMFLFSMTVAEGILDSPALQAGVKQITWAWGLDTDPETFPAGFPLPPGIANPVEFIVWVVWDGTVSTGQVIDRRPLLLGGQAVATPVPFKIKSADITVAVDESLIADPSSFVWGGFTSLFNAETDSGNFGVFNVDVTAVATWP